MPFNTTAVHRHDKRFRLKSKEEYNISVTTSEQELVWGLTIVKDKFGLLITPTRTNRSSIGGLRISAKGHGPALGFDETLKNDVFLSSALLWFRQATDLHGASLANVTAARIPPSDRSQLSIR